MRMRKKDPIQLVDYKTVPEAGLEPARPQWPRDFKSLVSTSSTTRADVQKKSLTNERSILERKTGFEPATLTLARLCSTS